MRIDEPKSMQDELLYQLYERFYFKKDDKKYSDDFTVGEAVKSVQILTTANHWRSVSTMLGQLAKENKIGKCKSTGPTKYRLITRRDEFLDKRVRAFQDFKINLDSFKANKSGKRLFFRGEPGDFPQRIPSIYRKNAGSIAKNSDKFYADLAVEDGDLELFAQSKATQLARFQHYQAPTRLLDITTNPLTALFFAVEGDKLTDRKVFFYAVDADKVKYQSSQTVNMKATLNWMEQTTIQKFLNFMKGKKGIVRARAIRYPAAIEDFMNSLNHLSQSYVYKDPSDIYKDIVSVQFAEYVRDSPRLYEQQGAFIMPEYLTSSNSKSLEKLNKSIISAVSGYQEIMIPKESVKELREYLSVLGVNAGTTYPDIEHYAEYVKSLYR